MIFSLSFVGTVINLGEGDILSELKSSNNNLRLQVNRLKSKRCLAFILLDLLVLIDDTYLCFLISSTFCSIGELIMVEQQRRTSHDSSSSSSSSSSSNVDPARAALVSTLLIVFFSFFFVFSYIFFFAGCACARLTEHSFVSLLFFYFFFLWMHNVDSTHR